MIQERASSWDFTPSEVRYLFRFFVWTFIVLLFVNAIVCRFIIGFAGQSLVHTTTNGMSYPYSWPALPPRGDKWPEPERIAVYSGLEEFLESTYAVGWDSNYARYVMNVVHIGKPFNTIETKETLVTKNGEVLHANPPVGAEPQMRWKIFGVILNPFIYSFVIWAFCGLFPVRVIALNRYSRYRRLAADALCPKCGYDILDLPICPECGTPAEDQS